MMGQEYKGEQTGYESITHNNQNIPWATIFQQAQVLSVEGNPGDCVCYGVTLHPPWHSCLEQVCKPRSTKANSRRLDITDDLAWHRTNSWSISYQTRKFDFERRKERK